MLCPHGFSLDAVSGDKAFEMDIGWIQEQSLDLKIAILSFGMHVTKITKKTKNSFN